METSYKDLSSDGVMPIIKSKFLPLTVTLYRQPTTGEEVITDSGDVNNALINAGTLNMRIVNNRDFNNDAFNVSGISVISTHLGFANFSGSTNLSGLIPDEGNIIDDGTSQYRVIFNDLEPGGVQNRHQQVYMNKIDK